MHPETIKGGTDFKEKKSAYNKARVKCGTFDAEVSRAALKRHMDNKHSST
jgi:hypothetical protein